MQHFRPWPATAPPFGRLQPRQVEGLALPDPGACEPLVHRIGPRLVALRQECLAQPEQDPTVVRRLPQRTPEGLFGPVRVAGQKQHAAQRLPYRIIPEGRFHIGDAVLRSEEHTSELQSLMRISYAVFCLKKKKI